MFWLLLLIICVLALNWQVAVLTIIVLIVVSNPIFLVFIATVALIVWLVKECEK